MSFLPSHVAIYCALLWFKNSIADVSRIIRMALWDVAKFAAPRFAAFYLRVASMLRRAVISAQNLVTQACGDAFYYDIFELKPCDACTRNGVMKETLVADVSRGETRTWLRTLVATTSCTEDEPASSTSVTYRRPYVFLPIMLAYFNGVDITDIANEYRPMFYNKMGRVLLKHWILVLAMRGKLPWREVTRALMRLPDENVLTVFSRCGDEFSFTLNTPLFIQSGARKM